MSRERSEEQRKQRLNLLSVTCMFWAEAYTFMCWKTLFIKPACIVTSIITALLLGSSLGFFILTSLSIQPVDY